VLAWHLNAGDCASFGGTKRLKRGSAGLAKGFRSGSGGKKVNNVNTIRDMIGSKTKRVYKQNPHWRISAYLVLLI